MLLIRILPDRSNVVSVRRIVKNRLKSECFQYVVTLVPLIRSCEDPGDGGLQR